MEGRELVSSGSGNRKVAVCRERRNEPSSSIKLKEFYHSFIQYTGSYMFRQWSSIIRELLGFV
jgi:hypothetical protein